MNDIVITDVGKVKLLSEKLTYLNNLEFHLYVNNYTPDHTSVIGDFTEASFPGYTPMIFADFGAAYLNSFNQGETDSGTHIWTQTADATAQNVYGWYATSSAGDLALASRNPAAPIVMQHAGDVYVVLVQFLEDQIPIP